MFTKNIIPKLMETENEREVCIPSFFRVNNAAEKQQLESLLQTKPHIKVFDTIASQLKELVKSQNPSLTLSIAEVESEIKKHLNGTEIADYGVWIYYPWSERLVHLLDEKEFAELRTNRNKYKITGEEQALLANKKIGIVGLSVGQSVAVTLAMERTFGELRIADFDELEITNMNRLRSSLHNMGLKKTVQVARDIAEIDPFLKIILFSEGLTVANMDAFFTNGGNLDVVIDECDGLDMKILLRHKAKALKIPVLMEASDRGTVDVERFDIEHDRPILHGFISHLDHTGIGSLTDEEKIPYLMPMLGMDTISKRLKASMVEVKQTISTWPQLASAVVLGGAICADICRRVLLGSYHESGRYFIDIEESIGDTTAQKEGTYDAAARDYPELSLAEMKHFADTVPASESSFISPDILKQFVEAAVAAPSAGNNQPWKWLSKNSALYLFHDKKQSFSWTDDENFIAQLGLGAALENLIIKAASEGYQPSYKLFPMGYNEPLVAVISFLKSDKSPQDDLEKYIGLRCTNRKKGNNAAIGSDILNSLKDVGASVENANVFFLTDRDDIVKLAAIESEAERIRFMHPQSHFEFFSKELRWNDSGKEIIREGLDIKTLELSLSDETGLKLASDKDVIALLNKWNMGKAFAKPARNAIITSSAIGLITMPAYTPENYINGGRAMERVWLKATKHQLAIHPISAPLFLYARVKYGQISGSESKMKNEIFELYRKLSILFPELSDRLGVFLFRLSKAETPSARSLRKSLDELYNVV